MAFATNTGLPGSPLGFALAHHLALVGGDDVYRLATYSGDPKSGCVRISNGQPCPVFLWRPDFEWQAFCPKPFENRTFFRQKPFENQTFLVLNHSKTGRFFQFLKRPDFE